MAFKVSSSGIMYIIVAALGTLFAAMPWMGLGPDASPEADGFFERRYGTVGIVLAIGWVALMALIALRGISMQFHPPKPRTRRR